MKNKPLKIELKSNSNISFDVNPEFCSCGRPMFLKRGRDGRVFWACKGFHHDESKKVCDHTRDLKCFRCKKGEVLVKQNGETKEKFYGCSDFSEISESSCNFSLQIEDMKDVIKQVNDGIKYRFNFRSIMHNEGDQKIIDNFHITTYKNTEKDMERDSDSRNECCDYDDDDDKVEDSWWYKLLKQTLVSEKGADGKTKTGPVITKRFAVYIVSLMFLIGAVAVVQGSGVEINLFNGMFVLNVKPVAPTEDNVDIKYDAGKGELVIRNTSSEDVDIGDLAVLDSFGNEMIDFKTLPGDKQLLEKDETIRLNEDDLFAMMDRDVLYFEDYSYDDGSYQAPAEEDSGKIAEEEEMHDYLLEQLMNNELNFVSEVIDNGREVYNELKTKVINKTEVVRDRYTFGRGDAVKTPDYLEVEGESLDDDSYINRY